MFQIGAQKQTIKKQKKFVNPVWVVIVIGAVISLCLIWLLHYWYLTVIDIDANSSVQQFIKVPREKGGIIGISDWRTYRNEEYGFEFKYPLDFEKQNVDSETSLLSLSKVDGGREYLVVRVMKNYQINQIISSIEEVKEINIGGHLGYKYFYIEGVGMSEVALIQVGQDALSISFDNIGGSQNFETQNDRKIYVQDFLNQILSTFKFIE